MLTSDWLKHLSCCKSYDELTDIAATIQAYTSIHFDREEWIKIRFFLMLYSCIIFMWTIIDSIFSDRTLFYFIYATHWILLLNVMLYLICSYVITLVIHERISSSFAFTTKSMQNNKKRYNKNKHKHNNNDFVEDIPLQQKGDNIPSLSELGLFKWNKFIVFLQNASLSPSIIFPVIFWFVIFPNIGSNHSWYDVLLEFHIHSIIPILILFDFTFSSRTVLYIDIYQPIFIGIIYCLWTYIIWTDNNNNNNNNNKSSFLYDKYYYFEINDYILWFILNLSGLCFIHLTFSFIKTKVLSKHFMSIQLSTNHTVVIDRNGNIINSNSKQYDKIQLLKSKKNKPEKKKIKKKKIKINKREKKKKNKQNKQNKHIIDINDNDNDNNNNNNNNNNDNDNNNNIIDHVNNDDNHSQNITNNTTNIHHQKIKNIERIEENENDKNDKNIQQRNNYMNDAGNSIKQGFKNLIAIIEPNKNDIKYTKAISQSMVDDDDDDDDDDITTTSDDSDDDDDENEDEEDDDNGFKRFYSLKGNESDMITTDDENGKFNAFKTKSMAALLNLSAKLHTISNNYTSGTYKSEIDYSEQETSGLSDDDVKFGLKSGLYDAH